MTCMRAYYSHTDPPPLYLLSCFSCDLVIGVSLVIYVVVFFFSKIILFGPEKRAVAVARLRGDTEREEM